MILKSLTLIEGCPRGRQGARHVQPLSADLREPLQDGEAQAEGALGRGQGQEGAVRGVRQVLRQLVCAEGDLTVFNYSIYY